MRPHESSSYFTARDGKIKSLRIPVTDIAPEEARGDSLEDALVIYRHFCDILKSRYGKPKRRKNRNGHYRSNFVTSQGVGVSGMAVLQQQIVLADAIEKWIISLKKDF